VDKPNTIRSEDLDGDKDCSYLGRVISASVARPPLNATWNMYCGNVWREQVLTLTKASPATTTAPQNANGSKALRLDGACGFQEDLNGPFVMQGTTASGTPFYKGAAGRYYLYFDPDCNGGPKGIPRWIIDSDLPDTSLVHDLDNDQDCKYVARIDSNASVPPAVATWLMYCQNGWEELQLTLEEIDASSIALNTTDREDATSAVSAASRLRPSGRLPLLVPVAASMLAAWGAWQLLC